MKGGTTSLFRYLGTHPEVSVSRMKETNFFFRHRDDERRLAWYRDQFDPDKPARGEASPNYTKRHVRAGVAERIAATLPDVRLLFVARDPVARIVSHYVHNLAHGRETRPFSEAVANDDRYVETSRYAYQLEPFLEHFPREHIMVVDSDDLRDDTATTMRAVFSLIGVRADHTPTNTGTQFHQSSHKTLSSPLERRVADRRVRALLRPLLPARLSERPRIQRPEPTPADMELLTRALRDDARRFRALTGLPFAGWPV